MRSKLLRVLPYGILAIVFLLAAPLIARIGSWETVRTWNATPGALGVSRPLKLFFQRYVAYVDVLGGYPQYRLVITKNSPDGGYAYIHYFQIRTADSDGFAAASGVTWDTNRVEFTMPKGEVLTIPAQVVIQQIGP